MSSDNDPTRELTAADFVLDPRDSADLEIDDDAADTATDAMLPRQVTLGEYVLLRPIGSGGVGHVFQARHRQMDRLVALKLLSERALDRPDAVRRFRREIKAAARLFHPNIVTAFDAGEHQGIQYLVMEYVEGMPLDELVERHGSLSPAAAAQYICQAAQGLAFAHSRAVVHRDIKPGNFILDHTTNIVKLLDLGTALFVGSDDEEDHENVLSDDPAPIADTDATQSGVILGTVNYMAPEQARRMTVDHRADIYSLGCTLFFLLTGRPVFEGDVVQTLVAHAKQSPPDLRDVRPDAPEWLNDIFQRMTAKNPNDRFQTMDDVVAAIREGQTHPENVPWKGRTRRTILHQAVGFDLGTSHGQAAWCRLSDRQSPDSESVVCGENLPAIVAAEGMNVFFGEQAWNRPATLQVAQNVRRYLGQRLYPYALDRAYYPPEILAALLLNQLNRLRGGHEDRRHVVLTAPSGFGEIPRQALLDAANVAGLTEVRLHNESTAAILSEGWKLRKFGPDGDTSEERWLVLDLGGGKMDVTAARLSRDRLRIIATASDSQLGGCDWDQAILDHVSQHCQARLGLDPREVPATAARLMRTCERAKIRLSTEFSAPVDFRFEGRRFRLNFTRQTLDRLTVHLEEQAENVLLDCLKQCGWKWSEVDRLLLVGRATRMPCIRNLVLRQASKSLPMGEASSGAVARGGALLAAAAWSAERQRPWGPKLELIASHCLGLAANNAKTGERRHAMLIFRGDALPARADREFRTREPNQVSVSVRVVEGKDSRGLDGQVIGFCEIDLPRGLPAGSPVVVEFRLGEDEQLTLSVETPDTGYRVAKDLTYRGLLSHVEISRWREWVETVLLCSAQP